MKIAAVTDDEKTISAHFGRASKYVVLTIEDGQITARETREKFSPHGKGGGHGHGHHHDHHEDPRGRGFGTHSEDKHKRMFAAISDCEVLLARGMGRGAHMGLQQTGIRPIITDIESIDQAALAVVSGDIVDHTELLH